MAPVKRSCGWLAAVSPLFGNHATHSGSVYVKSSSEILHLMFEIGEILRRRKELYFVRTA